jgi:dihydrofolate reductase
MSLPALAIIVAMDRRHIIGRDGALPWHLPNDLQQFKRITMGKPIIMGRRTHESIGRPLPGRKNIVVTRNGSYSTPGCEVAISLQSALELVYPADTAFVIGGAALYAEALALATQLYITEVHADVEGDVRFPIFNREAWREISRADYPADSRHAFAHSFVAYERRDEKKDERMCE